MGVYTTADQKRDEARQRILDAMQSLNELLDPATWGWNEYNIEFRTQVRQHLIELDKIQEHLS